MVRNIRLAAARAPIVIVGLAWLIQWCVPFITVAEASATRGFPAAVVVRNDVVFAVTRIVACSNPGNGRHVRTRRTTRRSPAATAAQEAIDRAMTPVVAG